MRRYQTAIGKEFEKIDRRDVFRMGEKNLKTVMYKTVPVRIESH